MLGLGLGIMTNVSLELENLSSGTSCSGLSSPRVRMCFG